MSVHVCYPNYLNPEAYSGLSAYSANSDFPVTNLQSTARRSRVYQSAGYFNVTVSNNVIVFRDASGGADKNATIAVGTYSTVAAFLAAVDAAFEAAGAANYTVTQTAAKKIQITSDLSGGATHFELRFADVASTARDMLGFAATNLTGASSYTAPDVRIHTEERITIDLGSAFNPQAFILFGPRNEPIRISQTATIKLQGNASDSWSSPAYDQTLTWNEFAIAKFSATGLHSSALRYWSIQIIDRDNPRGYIEISSIFLGDTIDLTRGCPQFPLEINEVDLSQSERTLAGGSFTAIYGKTAEIALDWQFLTNQEVEAFRDMFKELGTALPFGLILDPNEVFSSDLERYCLQVKFQSEPTHRLDRPAQWSSQWNVVEDV